MWKLRIEDDESNRTIVKLAHDEYTIGRDEDNVVRLTERNISRHHARLARERKGWVLYDLNSSYGCFLNQQRIQDSAPLKHGDLVTLGDYQLELTDTAQETQVDKSATLPGVPKSHGPSYDYYRLIVTEGPAQGTHFPLLQDNTVLGRGDECDIVFYDTSVSRAHAAIVRQEGNFEIHDRSSANGVRVNGRESTSVRLYPGDLIELGDIQLRFLPPGDGATDAAGPTSSSFSAPPANAADPVKIKMYATYAVGGVLCAIMVAVAMPRADSANVAAATEPGAASVATWSPEQQEALARESDEALLREALKILGNGDVVGAHRRAAELREGSSLRAGEAFKEIELQWATLLLSLAGEETDQVLKGQILNEVARTPNVDPALRQKAADQLSHLTPDTVDVSELPIAKVQRAKRRTSKSTTDDGEATLTTTSTKTTVPKTATTQRGAAQRLRPKTSTSEDSGDR